MATYTTTSKFVQLTPYLLMEYMYADQPNPETYFVNTGNPTVSYNKLINGALNGPGGTASNKVQIFNQNQNYGTTRNTSLNNTVQITENSFAPLNPNYIIPYNDFNDKLTSSSDLPVNFSSNFSITYDTVRYHILAGYNLENIDGLIIGIDYLDVDGTYVTFSQIHIDSGFSGQYTLNPNPVSIGINTFDKYFEIKIPSLLFLNNQYISAVNKPLTPASLLSKSGRGFVVGSPMRIRPYEILNTTLSNGYSIFGANLLSVLSLESEDPFTNIGALIAPADTGDFFEYFATDNEGFIEDFILFQNSIGNQYFIQNEIQVLEQIGTALVQTSNFFTIQTNAYDIPNLYRPIIRNSGVASSFTLRYTMTLVNNRDKSRVVREASYTSNNPSKYGSFIAPLQLQNLPQVQKIYNKVASETNISVPNSGIVPRTIIKYSNVFFERNLVNTSITNLVVNGTTITSADGGTVQDQIVYGQGKAFITISPFDSYYKFTFYKQSPNGDTQFIDLESSGTYYLVFLNNSNKKVSAPTISDKNIANPARGELAFKVSETLATDVLQYTDRRYFVTNRPPASSDPNLTLDQIPVTSAVKNSLAEKSTSLKDSSKDVILASKQATQGLNTDLLVISSESSSTLYWGYWLKQGETAIPSAGPTGPTGSTGPIVGTTTEVAAIPPPASVNTLANVGIPLDSVVPISAFPQTNQTINAASSASPRPLTATELKSAISSDVQGKISLGWTTPDIISYFLDPSQVGYKLYGGISKETFRNSVTGIFTNADLTLLNNYGNTGGGQTTGGPAATTGNTSNQTGFSTGFFRRPNRPNPTL
jgi:hypothetical protein